jgi:hypothetical protein
MSAKIMTSWGVAKPEAAPVKSGKANEVTLRNRVSRVVVVLGLAAVMGGCEPVQSLNPYFEPKDVVSDAGLDGTWITEKEEGFYMKLQFKGGQDKSGGYNVEVTFYNDQPEEGRPAQGAITFSVHLFQAGDCRFADFYPLTYSAKSGSQNIEFEAKDNLFGMPTHTVYRIKTATTHLQLAWLDDDRIERFITKNNLPLAIQGTDFFVLTGKTEELKNSLLLPAAKEDLLEPDGVELTRQE